MCLDRVLFRLTIVFILLPFLATLQDSTLSLLPILTWPPSLSICSVTHSLLWHTSDDNPMASLVSTTGLELLEDQAIMATECKNA